MSPRPTASQRRAVVDRAQGRCEYCLVHQDDAYVAYQIDHVMAEKHGGTTTLENLAFACMPCNLRKGSDISSVDPATGQIVPLFNPRTQVWATHFVLEGYQIIGRTPEGRATVALLRLNVDERQLERGELLHAGRYPTNLYA